MTTIEQKIISAHNWVKTVQRDFTPRGHKPLGERSSVVDLVYIPYLHTTFFLIFSSSWATTGGVRKVASLNAYDHRTGKQRWIRNHVISDGEGPMSHFYPTKIGATISFVTKDFHTNTDHNSDLWYEFGAPLDRAQVCRVGAVERRHWVTAGISMREENDSRARFEIKAVYETGYLEKRWLVFTSETNKTLVSSKEWTTGEVESSVLTRRNISRFYQKYIAELPQVTGEIGDG